MSILAGLGQFAGGVAKGIESESEINARNQAAEAAQEESDRKRRTDQDTRAFNALRVIDPTSRLIGNETVPDVLMRRMQEYDATQKAAAEENRPGKKLRALTGGIVGALTGRNAETAAQAAGVKPLPLAGMPGPPGSPSGAAAPVLPGAAAPEAPGVGLQAAAGGAPPAAAPAADPNEVAPLEVEGQPGREWTERDKAQYEMLLAAKYNQGEAGTKAMTKFKDLTTGEALKKISLLPMERIGAELGRLSGQDIVVEEHADGKGDVYVEGQLVQKNADRNDLILMARQHIEDNPIAGFEASLKYETHKADIEGKHTEIANLNAAIEKSREALRQLKELGPLTTQEQRIKVQKLQQDVDDKEFLAHKSNMFRDEERWDAAVRRQSEDTKDGNAWETTTTYDANNNKVQTRINRYERDTQSLRNHPQWKAEHVGIEGDGFRVLDPKTGKPTPRKFRNVETALEEAEKLWAASPEPRPATGQGGTVRRVPQSGIGVNAAGGAAQIPAN